MPVRPYSVGRPLAAGYGRCAIFVRPVPAGPEKGQLQRHGEYSVNVLDLQLQWFRSRPARLALFTIMLQAFALAIGPRRLAQTLCILI
jgi:hypothetical protein